MPSPLKRSPVPFQDSELATPPTTGRLIVAGKPSSPGGPRLVATPSTLEIPKTKPPPVRSVSVGDTVEYIGTDKIVRVVRIVRAASDPPSGTVNFSTPLAQALLDEPEGSDIILSRRWGLSSSRYTVSVPLDCCRSVQSLNDCQPPRPGLHPPHHGNALKPFTPEQIKHRVHR